MANASNPRTSGTWDPEQYERFRNERYQPFNDLVALLKSRPGLRVIDLGCGTGELTARLAQLLPESDVVGIDNSPEMLARAAKLSGPRLHFRPQQLEDVEGSWDVIFSNAVFQWIEGHEQLVPRLFSLLRPGGQLTAQMPANPGNAAPALVSQIATEEPHRSALKGWNRSWPQLPMERYAQILYNCGGTNITSMEKVYPHVLADADAAFEWSKGTALVPFLARLEPAAAAAFQAEFRRRLWLHWPTGPIFFPYRRILFAATKPETEPYVPQTS